jgi:hypothetical protein
MIEGKWEQSPEGTRDGRVYNKQSTENGKRKEKGSGVAGNGMGLYNEHSMIGRD